MYFSLNGISVSRSSRSEVFCKRDILKNFANLTGKYPCQSIFFKKETLAQVFSCEICKIFKYTFSHRTPQVAASEYHFFFCIFLMNIRLQLFNVNSQDKDIGCDQFKHYYVKSVRIRSISCPYFSAFGQNTANMYTYTEYVFSPNTGKHGPENSEYGDFSSSE